MHLYINVLIRIVPLLGKNSSTVLRIFKSFQVVGRSMVFIWIGISERKELFSSTHWYSKVYYFLTSGALLIFFFKIEIMRIKLKSSYLLLLKLLVTRATLMDVSKLILCWFWLLLWQFSYKTHVVIKVFFVVDKIKVFFLSIKINSFNRMNLLTR